MGRLGRPEETIVRDWKLGIGAAVVLMGVTQCVVLVDGTEEAAGGAAAGDGGECELNDRRCLADGVTLQQCDDAGRWQDLDLCAGVCTNGQCEESCEENTKQCANGEVLVCTGGAWETEETCEFVCDETADPPACSGACLPDDQSCSSDNWVRVCDQSGTWVRDTNCTLLDQTCAASGSLADCGGECAPGQLRCDGSNNAQQCSAGSWMLRADCDGPSDKCEAGECVVNPQDTIGNDDISGWSSTVTAAGGTTYAFLLPTSDVAVEVRHMGIGRTANDTGVQALIGVYEADGGGPGSLVMSALIPVIDGTATEVPTPEPTESTVLAAGQSYWVGVMFSGDPGSDFPAQPNADSDGARRTTSSWPNLPNPFNANQTHDGVDWPLFLTVRDYVQ